MTSQQPCRRRLLWAAAGALLAVLPVVVCGQPSRMQAAVPQPAPAATVPSVPQRTTATFGDWTLRCERPVGAAETCEIVQVVSAQGQTVAQIAVGRPARGNPLILTVLVPASVTLAQQPRLGGPGKDASAVDLVWRRCLPGGCFASATLPDDVVRLLRARADGTSVVYIDGAGKEAALPFSPKGMSQALDALAREENS